MAKTDLTFRIFGKDVSATKTLKGVGGTAGKIGSKLGGIGTAFAGIGTAAVAAGALVAVDFGKKSVSAFIDAQESQTKFEDSFKSPKLAGYTSKIDALAQSLALKTKFDDDATKSAAALLAKFDLTGDQIAKTLPLAQDYAAFTGKSLPAASKILGKAFLGNTKALKDMGIAYKPTGDKAKDMAAIMGLVNDKVGGFAEKQGKTAAGTAAILSNQFGEVQETIGSYLVPALVSIGQWIIGTVIPAIGQLVGWLQTNLGPVITAVGGWITSTFVPAVQSLAAAFMTNVWPAIQMVAGIIAENLQPVITALAEYWTSTLYPGIQKMVPILARVAQVVGIVVGAFAVAVSWILGKVVPVLMGILGPAINFVIGVLGKVADAVGWVIDNFGNIVAYVKGIPEKFRSGLGVLADIITAPFRTAFNLIASLWNNTVGALSFSIPDWVPGVGGNGWDVPDIPMLAKGGIVTRPTLALIGEAGPEAVIPLGGSRGFGGGGINIYVTQPLGTPAQIGRAVKDAMRQAEGNGRTR